MQGTDQANDENRLEHEVYKSVKDEIQIDVDLYNYFGHS